MARLYEDTYDHPNQQVGMYNPPPPPPPQEQILPPPINFTGYPDRVRTEPVSLHENGAKPRTRKLYEIKDTGVLIENHDSYHGEMTGEEAEWLLSTRKETSYLTRRSIQQNSNILSVMVKNHRGESNHVHIKLIVNNKDEIYQLDGHEKSYQSIHELLDYFEHHSVSSAIVNIGEKVLSQEKKLQEQKQQQELEDEKRRQMEEKIQKQMEAKIELMHEKYEQERQRRENDQRERDLEREQREQEREKKDREQREREQREREQREQEREKRDREQRERDLEREKRDREQRECEQREREQRDREYQQILQQQQQALNRLLDRIPPPPADPPADPPPANPPSPPRANTPPPNPGRRCRVL